MKRRFALDVLILGENVHGGGWAKGLMKYLHKHPAIRSYGIASAGESKWAYPAPRALELIRDGRVNTVFVHPTLLDEQQMTQYFEEFIPHLREQYPNLVFVLYARSDLWDMIVDKWPRYRNYFHLDEFWFYTDTEPSVTQEREVLDVVLRKCEEWHETRFEYDVALSFAGAQRKFARNLANALEKENLRVFFDEREQERLLGRDLISYLHEVYALRSRFCMILVSKEYADRMWTIHERRSAQERALRERGIRRDLGFPDRSHER